VRRAILHNRELHFDQAPWGKPRVWAHDPNSYVDCTFDEHGDLVEIETTTRWRGTTAPVPWSVRFPRYAPLGGARVPVEAEVSWDPPEGRQVYWGGHVDHFGWR
jgi:hypothetical protein